MNKTMLNAEICRLYIILSKTFLNEDDAVPKERIHIADVFLEKLISYILFNAEEMIETCEKIQKTMQSSDMYDEICKRVSFDRAFRNATIRKDFGSAFETVVNGRELAMPLDWSLSNRDIIELAKLHKAGKHREKIEDLLEDCNFHYECGVFSSGNYSEWL